MVVNGLALLFAKEFFFQLVKWTETLFGQVYAIIIL